jgi:pSer/pThr/pTyr-binding forkhead associated (FHA) protein
MDLNSRNGTVVNRKKCRPWLPVRDGDVIKLGHTLIVFTTRDFETYEQGEGMYKQLRELHAERVERNEDSQADYGIRAKGKSKQNLGSLKEKTRWFRRK